MSVVWHFVIFNLAVKSLFQWNKFDSAVLVCFFFTHTLSFSLRISVCFFHMSIMLFYTLQLRSEVNVNTLNKPWLTDLSRCFVLLHAPYNLVQVIWGKSFVPPLFLWPLTSEPIWTSDSWHQPRLALFATLTWHFLILDQFSEYLQDGCNVVKI